MARDMMSGRINKDALIDMAGNTATISPQAAAANLAKFLKGSAIKQPVYHGTSEAGLIGDTFDAGKLGSVTKSKSAKAGHFFVNDESVAKGYSRVANEKPVAELIARSEAAERAGKWDEANRLMEKAERLEATATPKENVIPAYLSVKKPFVFNAEGQRFLDIQDEIHDAIAQAKTGGHDGIQFRNLVDNADWGSSKGADHWVAFEPTQIKHATKNRGTFDPTNPSILAGISALAFAKQKNRQPKGK